MHDFLAALVPEPFQVLGVPLKPLSYGHVVLLTRMDIDPVCHLSDLVLAVSVCRRSFTEGLAFFQNLARPAYWIEFQKQIDRYKEHDEERALEAWADYLETNSSHPEYIEAEGFSSDRGAPMLAQLREVLLRNGYSPKTLMDAPYGQCLWDYGCFVEAQQGFGIIGDRHREVAALLRKARN